MATNSNVYSCFFTFALMTTGAFSRDVCKLFSELNMVTDLPLRSLSNSLTTVGYLLEVFIKLWIPSMVRIFTSA